METIPPGEHLEYLLLGHALDSRSSNPDVHPIAEKTEFS